MVLVEPENVIRVLNVITTESVTVQLVIGFQSLHLRRQLSATIGTDSQVQWLAVARSKKLSSIHLVSINFELLHNLNLDTVDDHWDIESAAPLEGYRYIMAIENEKTWKSRRLLYTGND